MSYSPGDPLEPADEDNKNKKGSSLKTSARLAGLGFELIFFVIIFLYINKWVEKKVDLKGLGPVIFLFLALGCWIYRIVVTLNKIDKEDKSA